MSTNLNRIAERAGKEPELVFTSLYHHVTDVDNLRSSYDELNGNKAVGVDGVTKKAYGENLEANLEYLSSRLKRMGYTPEAKRRTHVPKIGSKKGRPLGISCFEDKIVELAVKRVLEPIYELEFTDSSYGYRVNRSPHDCLDEIGRRIQQCRINHVVEADVRSFFDKVNHGWLLKFVRHRIGDERIVRLIARMLKAGIMEDGLVRASTEGTPQGSILSPLLSNIYLHYVLDLWFERRFKRSCQGKAYCFRYADDFVVCFQFKKEAELFLGHLRDRMKEFALELAEEKTHCLEFGRFARENARRRGEKPSEFTFLGFTHYCGKTRRGTFKVKRRTSKKKFRLGLKHFTEWAGKARRKSTKGQMLRGAKARIEGTLNYYAITDNLETCSKYVYQATRILCKWLNRKSQRRTYTWSGFNQAILWLNWPRVRIRKDLNPFRRPEALLMIV